MNCFHLYLLYFFFSYPMLSFRASGHCVVAEDWVAGAWGARTVRNQIYETCDTVGSTGVL